MQLSLADANLADRAAAYAAVDKAQQELGSSITLLINNAGIVPHPRGGTRSL